MNITKQQIDALNTVITINIDKSDYAESLNKELKDYRKNASIPGFRKGQVPLSIIKKRYEKAIIAEEINKILLKSLSNYINEEKMDILGDPIPSDKNNIDFESENFSFDFQIGLAPEFSVDLNIKNNPYHKIKLDEKLVDEEIENIKKQHGNLFPKDQYEIGDELTGIFSSDFEKISRRTIISQSMYNKKTSKKLEKLGNLRDFFSGISFNNFIFNEGKNIADKFIGKKINEVIIFSAKELFPKFSDLIEYFGISPDTQEQDFDISFTISEINGYQPAEITQEIIDNLTFEKGELKSEEELRQRIINNYNIENSNLTEPKFYNNTFDFLIKNTKFDLPSEFLKKWIQHTSKEPLTAEQIEEEYKRTEESLRYQLIEQKIIADNNLNITIEEIRDFAEKKAKAEVQKYSGNISSEQLKYEIEKKAKDIISDRDKLNDLTRMLMDRKIIDLLEEKSASEIIEVTKDEFVELSKKEEK